jgi:16S rRNA (guanine527-N7)-methyltransferase
MHNMTDTPPTSATGTIPAFVTEQLQQLAIELTEAQLQLLAKYLDNLLEVNKQFNLTGIRDRDEAWRKLIIDSLTVLPALRELTENAKVVDVGSGGGLPGIPIAIARPDLLVTLIESTGKKAKFLEQCAREIPLPKVRVIKDRAENSGQSRKHREEYDVAVCRAVGPMRQLLEYTLPLVRQGGALLAMKGPSVEKELDEAGDAMMILGAGEVQLIDAYPESFGIETCLVWIQKERPAPQEYPRLPGMSKTSPL